MKFFMFFLGSLFVQVFCFSIELIIVHHSDGWLNVNADKTKTSMILFTKWRDLKGFVAQKLFKTELKLNNQAIWD
jgi:hypothetical protein